MTSSVPTSPKCRLKTVESTVLHSRGRSSNVTVYKKHWIETQGVVLQRPEREARESPPEGRSGTDPAVCNHRVSQPDGVRNSQQRIDGRGCQGHGGLLLRTPTCGVAIRRGSVPPETNQSNNAPTLLEDHKRVRGVKAVEEESALFWREVSRSRLQF